MSNTKQSANNIKQLLKLIEDNPNLQIVPMVDSEVVADDCYCYWKGTWGHASIEEIYIGKERVHIKSLDDEEDVLNDMDNCQYGYDYYGRDIYELSDEEWNNLYESLPWEKVIVVYIST